MDQKQTKLLETICSFPAVSGNEQELIEFLFKLAKPHSQKIFIDNFGNLICQKGRRPNQLVIVAHADKIGFVISKSKPKIEAVGLFKEVEDKLPKNKPKPAVIDGLFISYEPNFKITKQLIKSQGLDNALGVLAALELLKALKNGTVVFTVQDATYADDPRSAVKSGGGVSFCVKDNFLADKTMLSLAVKVCQKNNLAYQLEVILEGNSDIDGVYDVCGGLPYLFVGIPIKKMHTARESAAISDLETTIKFLQLYVKKWGKMK